MVPRNRYTRNTATMLCCPSDEKLGDSSVRNVTFTKSATPIEARVHLTLDG